MHHFDINGIVFLGAVIVLYYLVMLPYWDYLAKFDVDGVQGDVFENDDDFEDDDNDRPTIVT